MLSFDKEKLNGYFSDETEILCELIDDFFSELPSMLAPIKDSIEKADMGGLQISAHTLKGAVSNFFPPDCVEHSYELEKIGKSGVFDLNLASEHYQKLEAALQILEGELKEFSKELSG
ncbi:hypothetical protein A9Q84_11505 [Halobacteriovorax marinus]|uniref:HPt domain-containing protein n=1 Tax=Halobacteriovorax marinus TaxID=97084 RepID=A0A1Y5F873_9BACT|nr:hypothetical protein A9Q84_11505 [Halobacteriovorax marinus]